MKRSARTVSGVGAVVAVAGLVTWLAWPEAVAPPPPPPTATAHPPAAVASGPAAAGRAPIEIAAVPAAARPALPAASPARPPAPAPVPDTHVRPGCDALVREAIAAPRDAERWVKAARACQGERRCALARSAIAHAVTFTPGLERRRDVALIEQQCRPGHELQARPR